MASSTASMVLASALSCSEEESCDDLLAFAPGGQAELVVLALIVGADAAFVVAHHVLRMFVVILGAPLAAKLFSPTPRD